MSNYADIFEGLKNKPHNTVDGVSYGIPHGRGANLLMYNTDKVKPGPGQLERGVGPDSPQYKGKVTAYDSPIYIADAALYLKATQPDLGIANVYELDDKQFTAADRPAQDSSARSSASTGRTTPRRSTPSPRATRWSAPPGRSSPTCSPPTRSKVKAILPKEGSTGWSDTWMISSKAKNPNCMYMWMDHIASPKANAQATEYFGEAPSNKKACALTTDKKHCDTFHADRRGLLRQGRLLDDPGEGLRRRPRRGLQGLLGMGQGLDRDQGLGLTDTDAHGARTRVDWVIDPVARVLHGRRWLQLTLLLAAPLGWLVVAYLGALAVMLFNGLWRYDLGLQEVIKDLSLENFRELLYQRHLLDHHAAHGGDGPRRHRHDALSSPSPSPTRWPRWPPPGQRRWLLVAVLLPLWASYVVKVYAWRTILAEEGVLNWMLDPFGMSGPGTGGSGLVAIWLTFTYLWLPFMILPIYTGLERIPDSLLDASSDLGASPVITFRQVILPLAFPSIVAGSIFTFSLTLGDYITPRLVSSSQFIGNVIYDNLGVAGNIPFAAAYAAFPLVIMIGYLLVARRLGAFDNL